MIGKSLGLIEKEHLMKAAGRYSGKVFAGENSITPPEVYDI